MATPKPMKLIDPRTGQMQCKVCGSEHYASIMPGSGGHFRRGSWQCVNGCKPDPRPAAKVNR